MISLQALVALGHNKRDPLAIGQTTSTLAFDITEMNEDVVTLVPCDKAVAFFGVKPLNSAFLEVFLREVVIVVFIIVIVMVGTLTGAGLGLRDQQNGGQDTQKQWSTRSFF